MEREFCGCWREDEDSGGQLFPPEFSRLQLSGRGKDGISNRPPHRSVRAELPHKMCSHTFYAVCGRENYVAPSG